jgi:hypothetical protein
LNLFHVHVADNVTGRSDKIGFPSFAHTHSPGKQQYNEAPASLQRAFCNTGFLVNIFHDVRRMMTCCTLVGSGTLRMQL